MSLLNNIRVPEGTFAYARKNGYSVYTKEELNKAEKLPEPRVCITPERKALLVAKAIDMFKHEKTVAQVVNRVMGTDLVCDPTGKSMTKNGVKSLINRIYHEYKKE